MYRPQDQIPDWYQDAWTPVEGRRDLPQISWEDVETVLDDLASTPARREAARQIFLELRLMSIHLSPMDLLQQIILSAAAVGAPNPPRAAPIRTAPTSTTPETLPRWSCTDVEVALTYTCKGQALHTALERQRDLLKQRGELSRGVEALRSLFLIAFGLPPSRRRTAASPPTIDRIRVA